MSDLTFRERRRAEKEGNHDTESYDVSVEKLQSTEETKEQHNGRVLEFTEKSLNNMHDGDVITVKSKIGNSCQTIK